MTAMTASESNDPDRTTSNDRNLADEFTTVVMNNTNSTEVEINNEFDIVTLQRNLTATADFTNSTDDFTNSTDDFTN
jgi:hypothetical protein